MSELKIEGDWAWIDTNQEPLHIYDEQYFQNYVNRSKTTIGKSITDFRVNWIRSFGNSVIDIGIGCGAFLSECIKNNMEVYGYDIMPPSVNWLKERSIYWNPFEKGFPQEIECITFFDCLEHFTPQNAQRLLSSIDKQTVIISVPIYTKDWVEIKSWRHWKPNEHLMYWRKHGLLDWMKKQGFLFAGHSWRETQLGRLDIETYAFRKW